MKINRVYRPFIFAALLSLPMSGLAEKSTPQWSDESQAVYDLLLAQLQNADADYAGSVETLVRFAKKYKDERLFAKAYQALLQTEKYAQAVDLALLWKKNSRLSVDKFYVLALALNKETDKALSIIKKNLQSNDFKGHHADLLKQLDKSFLQDGKLFGFIQLLMSQWHHTEILTLMEKLYENYPDNTAVGKAYVDLSRWHGQTDKAVKVIDESLFKTPKDLSLLQEKSDTFRYALRLDEAQAVWENALKDYPKDDKLRLAYAQFLYDKYDFSGAKTELEKLEKKPTELLVARVKMMVQVQLGDYQAAEKAYAWSQLDTAEKDKAYYQFGQQLLEKKAYDLAFEQFEKISEKSPLALAADLKIGQIKYARSLVEGEAWFVKLKHKHHLDGAQWVSEKASAMQGAKKEQAAYNLLNTYLEKNPQNQDIRYFRAILSAEMGLEEQAIQDLKQLHTVSPDNADIQNALGYTLLSQSDAVAYAVQLIKKAFFRKPANPAIADSMGWAYYQQQQYEAALPFLRYAYGQYLDGEIIGHYIVALLASGQKSLAKTLYQLEVQYEPNKEKIQQITQAIQKELK